MTPRLRAASVMFWSLVVCGQTPPWGDPFPTGPPPSKPGGRREEQPAAGLLLGFRGDILSVDAKSMLLATSDGRQLRIFLTKSTRFVRKGDTLKTVTLAPGAEVSVEARQNAEYFLYAVSVEILKDAAPAAGGSTPPAAPADSENTGPTTTMAPPPAADPDDAGPPRIKRGKPERVLRAARDEAGAPPTAVAASSAPSVRIEEPMEDPQIAKARQAAAEFTSTLPNYVVRQHTTRYWSDTAKVDWRPLDVLSLAVVYENGKESYRNIRLNNKLVSKSLEELGGTVSQGEFGTTLADLLSSSTQAEFRRRGSSSIAGRPAWRFDFQVPLSSSHWTIRVGSQSIRPAYKGAIWVDQETARVLRIEMQAQQLPGDYPLDISEWVVEYGMVKLGSREFLVPVKAEVLACWRGSAQCSRNVTEFRNYRRFTGESDIYMTESTVDFAGEAGVAPAAPPKP